MLPDMKTPMTGLVEINRYGTMATARELHPLHRRVELVDGTIAIAHAYEMKPSGNSAMGQRGWETVAVVLGEILPS
jgi:hypothetical protein